MNSQRVNCFYDLNGDSEITLNTKAKLDEIIRIFFYVSQCKQMRNNSCYQGTKKILVFPTVIGKFQKYDYPGHKNED